ncbi:leucine-rich colipase-like protein 1 isoform X3 [Lutra lutra]|uniref:leucine-rich colipase-like protein 1 isoform X3 n=1 Tax=Lutra lutra TaxID=9657 RepID=UPI001FD18097|nr:leucine-rich colipase-like protein 1 isoform X3 [Lutra lutra]
MGVAACPRSAWTVSGPGGSAAAPGRAEAQARTHARFPAQVGACLARMREPRRCWEPGTPKRASAQGGWRRRAATGSVLRLIPGPRRESCACLSPGGRVDGSGSLARTDSGDLGGGMRGPWSRGLAHSSSGWLKS